MSFVVFKTKHNLFCCVHPGYTIEGKRLLAHNIIFKILFIITALKYNIMYLYSLNLGLNKKNINKILENIIFFYALLFTLFTPHE